MNQFCVYFVGFVDWVLIHTAKLITSLSILRPTCKGRSAFVLARQGTLSGRREERESMIPMVRPQSAHSRQRTRVSGDGECRNDITNVRCGQLHRKGWNLLSSVATPVNPRCSLPRTQSLQGSPCSFDHSNRRKSEFIVEHFSAARGPVLAPADAKFVSEGARAISWFASIRWARSSVPPDS